MRTFLIRPDADRRSQRLFLYLLGVYLKRYGIELHCVIQMSDHYHLLITDRLGLAPRFFRDFHAKMANVFKLERGWADPLWDKEQTTVIEPVTDAGAIRAIAYIVTNGVAAGIVDDPKKFPGAIILPHQIGRLKLTVRRPEHPLLDGRPNMFPDTVTLEPTMPQRLVDELGENGARHAVIRACDERVAKLGAARRAEGLGYLGAAAMCRIPHTYQAPNKDEPGPAPLFIGGPGGGAAVERAKAERHAWTAAYDDCWERWQRGELELVWPAHTWKMHDEHKRPRLDSG